MGNKRSKSFNRKSNNSSVKVKLGTKSLIIKQQTTLDDDFEIVDLKFFNLEDLLYRTQKLLTLSFDSFALNLSNYLTNERKHSELIRQQRDEFHERIAAAAVAALNPQRQQMPLLLFKQGSKHLDSYVRETCLDLGVNFSVFKKIKYITLHARFETIELNKAIDNNDCYNYIAIPLSRERVFICIYDEFIRLI